MYNLYDKVRIISNNLVGTIVDIRHTSDTTVYTVESDTKGVRADGYGGIFPLYDCLENEIVSL